MPNQNFRVKNGLEVGTGATISSGGNITAGIISATSFVGSGSQLTGVVASSGIASYSNVSGVSSSVVGGAVSATSLTVTGVSTFEGAISVRNGYNLNIGDNNDLRIYNDGTDSRIEETGSGSLYISGSDINIQQDSTNENIAKFIGGGAVELYYNDGKKFSTSGIGVTINGTLVVDQANVSGVATATSFVKSGGTSSQFLKADGSVDSSTYITSYTETDTLNSVTNRGNSTSNGISVGVVTATSVRDGSGNVRAVPQNSQTSAYILVASDVGKHIGITTGGVTVNAGIFSAGDAVSIYNNSSSNQTITQGTSVTMYLVGTATTGNRTLAQRGVATVLCVGTDTFVIMGGGLT